MAETVTGSGVKGKIARKYMAHFLDASFGGTTPEWYRLGEDLEEYSVDLNPDTEVKKNILGNTSFNHNGYEPSADSDPYYARVGDPLFEHLQDIVGTLATDDGCKTSSLEVHLWDGSESAGFTAYKQDCYVVPTSYGGDTSGYQIPFSVNYVGDKTKGTYNPTTKAFTASTESAG